ncbi:MAG: hypothetical protein ABFS32_19195, partial [Bacteroidota bacterium]
KLASSANIPLGPSGLKLTKLGGEFGYNYAIQFTETGTSTGNPQEGNYVVGLTLGVADLAGMVEVEGTSLVQFGNGKFDLNLDGQISIPKQNSVAVGKVNANYKLPDHTLAGSLGLDVNVPPSTGKVLNGNFEMKYAAGGGNWSVSSTDISASLFREVQFTGNIALAGSTDKDTFSGVLSGSAAYDFSIRKDFKILAWNLRAQLATGFNFKGDIAFDDTGAEGNVSLNIYANGDIGVENDIGGYDTVIGISGSSLAQLKFNRENVTVTGQMDVTFTFKGFEYGETIHINQTI